MVNIKLNNWYVVDNKMSISLMRCFVMIDLVPNEETKRYEMIVFIGGVQNMKFYFDTVESAVSFTQDTIAKCVDLDTIKSTQTYDNRRRFPKVKINKINQRLK